MLLHISHFVVITNTCRASKSSRLFFGHRPYLSRWVVGDCNSPTASRVRPHPRDVPQEVDDHAGEDDDVPALEILQPFRRLIQNPNGIIGATGPTGSGKTTTLYSALHEINTPELNISTIEDPIEIQLEGVTQSQVNHSIDLKFATLLRALMRQDPDAILIGEIRDLETAKIATEAALTGHIVFATLHTNSAPQAITRLIEIGVEPYMVAPSVIGDPRAAPCGADLRELQGGLYPEPGNPREVLQGGGADGRHVLPGPGLPQVPGHRLQGPRRDPRACPHHRGYSRAHFRGEERQEPTGRRRRR